jgi:transcriptional regulator with XRE-family HTH domain
MELSTYIASNIKRLRKVKNLSQKQVAMSIDIAQAQYSVIESGKTVPTLTTLEKIANIFEVDLSQLVKKSNLSDEDINLSILEKIKLIDALDKDEKDALFKMIDIAISKKKLKDNLANLMEV